MNEDWTLLENFTKTSWFSWFLLPCFCVHRHFSISKGAVFQSLWYILQLIWIGSSSTQYIYPIYLNHLLVRAWGLDILRFRLGGAFFRQWNIILGANTFQDIREEWYFQVLNDRGDISSHLPNLNWISLLLMVRRSLATTPLLTISTLELSHHPSSWQHHN